MMIFPANPTTVATLCRDGAPAAFRIEHPALDTPFTVEFSNPGKLDRADLKAYCAGMDLTHGRLANDLIGALAALPNVSRRAAEALPDIWEAAERGERSHLRVAPF